MHKKPIYGLVCAGGGAHGAYQVGALKYIHEHFSRGSHSPFQIFTGASCGALNTTFYAAESFQARQSQARLEEMWREFHVPAYHGNLLKNILWTLVKQMGRPKSAPPSGLLDSGPMNRTIQKGYNRAHMEESLRQGSTLGVGIAATEIVSGRTCWFLEGKQAKEWNLFHSLGLRAQIAPEHLAASCSVPIFLAPVKIGSHYFLDGSVSLHKPLSAAISMGATKILTIATDRPVPQGLPEPHHDFKPRVTSVIRLLLNRLSHDAAADEAAEIEAINRFYQGLSRKSRRLRETEELPLYHEESKPSHYHQTEIFRLVPSKRIRSLSGIEEGSLSVRSRTRFMFHASFIRELMELGYRDAESQKSFLQNFFAQTPEKRNLFGRISERAA